MDGQHRDPAWLRAQIIDRQRTYADIAAECGIAISTVNYQAKRAGIPTRGLRWGLGTGRQARCHPDRPHHAHGLCADCYQREWRNLVPATCHPDRPHVARGLCAACYRAEQVAVNRDLVREQGRQQRRRLRLALVAAYGGRCVCCGETQEAFLTLEHANGDGAEHRRRVGVAKVYSDLKRRGWPREGYTLLCANCNQARARLGHCPHQQESS